jgi:very-short-patch-repair endonuclease
MRSETNDRQADVRRARRLRAQRLAAEQAGILSRRQLMGDGWTRWQIRAELRGRRWRAVGRQCLSVHAGPLPPEARHWVAVIEAGPRAFLDGESALVAAGLTGYRVAAIRVSVPRGARIYRRLPDVQIRQTRRWAADDVAAARLPRARAEVAAVRAALWARTDRQAALLLTMVVQQGLATAEQLAGEMLRIRRDKRRALLHVVVLDLLGGVRSLGELDVVRECRRRGLPEPDKQVLRRSKNGTYYLDLLWTRWGLVVEVDGIQHSWANQVVGDAVRQNDVSLQGLTVLRLPLLGLRLDADTFFAQIEQALVAAGCPLAA